MYVLCIVFFWLVKHKQSGDSGAIKTLMPPTRPHFPLQPTVHGGCLFTCTFEATYVQGGRFVLGLRSPPPLRAGRAGGQRSHGMS